MFSDNTRYARRMHPKRCVYSFGEYVRPLVIKLHHEDDARRRTADGNVIAKFYTLHDVLYFLPDHRKSAGSKDTHFE